MYGARITETTELNGAVIVAASTGTTGTDVINLSRARRWIAVVTIPTLGSSSVVDAGLFWGATATGSFTAITGAAIAQESVGNKVYQIEITSDAVTNFASTAKYMIGYVVVGTASAGNVTMTIRGDSLRYEPGTNQSAIVGTNVIAPGV